MDYKHLKCDCGGVIGIYDREHFSCEKCGKIVDVQWKYDRLMINEKTGWIFPMVAKERDTD